MAFHVKLNGVSLRTPDFSIQHFKITDPGRVASGKMVMDIIARKRKFSFKYPSLSGADYRRLLDLLDSDIIFYELEYVENDVVKTATVYSGAIDATKYRTDAGAWYWKDVKFDLIEQ